MTGTFNKTEVKCLRRCLRRNAPLPESILWSQLRNRQLSNSKWKRQYSIGKFVVDFYCAERRLAIEIDGDSHFNKKAQEYDKEREEYIKSMDINFLRFTNMDVMNNLEGALEKIIFNLTLPLIVKERGAHDLTQHLIVEEKGQ